MVSLSADAVEPNEAAKATGSAYAAPQLAYKAVIELEAQNLTLPNGEQLKLTPGMAATIEIHQGEKDGDGVPVESGAAGDERGGEGAVRGVRLR